MKQEYIDITSPQKWKFTTSVPLKNFMSGQWYHLPLWHMDKKTVTDVPENKMVAKLRLYYI